MAVVKFGIDKEVYDERHPNVAAMLNNIGETWDALGDSQRAKEWRDSVK